MQVAQLKGFDTDAARILASHNLSERQTLFIWLYLQGLTKEAAAEQCGYSGTSGTAVFRGAKVQAALSAVMDRFIVGELAPMALRAAHDIMSDPKAPAGVRANLAMGILDRAGFSAKRHEKGQGVDKDPTDMSSDELRRKIDELQAAIEAKMRDVTPDDAPSATQDIDLYP